MAQTFVKDLLKGQVALVTGGGSGLGLGMAQAFAEHGASVLIASRNAERLEQAEKTIRASAPDAQIERFALDVRKSEDVEKMLDRAWERFGRLDLLVNNAAGNFWSPAIAMSDNAFGSVVNIDLFGTFYGCRAAGRRWLEKEQPGRIINISMTLHYRGFPGMVHASAAKAGIDALTRTLAQEWAPMVRVNAIAPGPIPTEGVKKAFMGPDGKKVFPERSVPLGRLGTPDDVANAALFLASPAADWITGQILVVDGGEWLHRPPVE
jgi:peroxisomal 2,4-dienoyl-CoA reductase